MTETTWNEARAVLQAEGEAILSVAAGDGLAGPFAQAVELILGCAGHVVVTGVGKAGIIGEKISATMASTGTSSIVLHPVEALHGDLGRVSRGDVVIAISNSGSSEEILRLLDHLKRIGAKVIALTGDADSPLGRHADITLAYGKFEEACPLGAAPSVSTTVLLAVGDALALTVMRQRKFQPQDYAKFHPGGALGRKFLKVEEVMTDGAVERLSAANDALSLGEALASVEGNRRSGALVLVDEAGRLSGILTDADVRRLMIQTPGGDLLATPVAEVMTRDPKSVHLGQLASEAEAILNEYRIDELPVVDDEGKPVGVLDVQDLLGLNTLK
ncbi:MAG: KpsF/GutQ family sugar-phosphate isomerase [Phycisphaerales bacterium]|jgi:arabinose-5-phosphate isomerase|nr:KpsF/GutQ family sugar-phosphate isomerase [Phycisphaerales bacterium]MBT7170764.1 KpsF/GutQ family sugar-phosphate isomerase [Phycisphaerales bacterium]